MPPQPTLDLERFIAYFRSSSFDYLALRHPGGSLTLEREPASPGVPLLAPSVGLLEPPAESASLPRSGDEVTSGAWLFSIRRFDSVVAVHAPASGRLASAHLEPGSFVEYGELLGMIDPD
jgi:biotin carboxyl carrier protein